MVKRVPFQLQAGSCAGFDAHSWGTLAFLDTNKNQQFSWDHFNSNCKILVLNSLSIKPQTEFKRYLGFPGFLQICWNTRFLFLAVTLSLWTFRYVASLMEFLFVKLQYFNSDKVEVPSLIFQIAEHMNYCFLKIHISVEPFIFYFKDTHVFQLFYWHVSWYFPSSSPLNTNSHAPFSQEVSS